MRGSVYRRGNFWTVRWDVPGPVRTQRSKGGFPTRRAAEEWLSAQLARIGQGVVDTSETVSVFAARWLPAIRHEIAPSTWDGYETHWRVWLQPAIGHYRLTSVTPPDLQAVYNRVVEAGRSPRTARYVHATAHRLYRDAVRWGAASRNPADGAEPPRQERKVKRAWTADETARFLESVEGTRWAGLWWFAADSAVRRSELIALRWPAVDGDTVTVQRGKTKSARRSVTLIAPTVAHLTAWRKTQAEERLRAGGSWLGEDRVWTWEDGRPVRGDWLSHLFPKIVAEVGLPELTLHELRHSWATQALERGVPLTVVQHRLGHSSISVTADFYTRVPEGVDRDAAAAVGGLWRARNAHDLNVG